MWVAPRLALGSSQSNYINDMSTPYTKLTQPFKFKQANIEYSMIVIALIELSSNNSIQASAKFLLYFHLTILTKVMYYIS